MQTSPGEWIKVSSNEALDLMALRPGDIILFRPKGLESALIAHFGNSKFSHAQLLVRDDCLGAQYKKLHNNPTPERERCSLVIEATTDIDPITKKIAAGVGYRRLPRRYLRRRGMSPFESRTVSPLSSYVYFDVFRHRAAATEEFRTFITERVPKLCQRYANQPYASLSDLAQVSAMPLTVEALGKFVKTIPRSSRPGLFCSQLVASIFADGGFPLTQRPASRTRPQDLASASTLACITPNTRLVIDEDAVIRTYAQLLEEVLPGIDELLESVGEGGDFRRTVSWGLRDRLDEVDQRSAQVEQLIASVDGLATMVERILQECREGLADAERKPPDGA
jgi:hypothetical protein